MMPAFSSGLFQEIKATICERKRFLITIVFVFMVVGLGIALLSPVEYQSEVQLMPELPSKSAVGIRQFGAFAEMMGIDLDHPGIVDAVRPDLYPHVVRSTPFVLYILDQLVTGTAGRWRLSELLCRPQLPFFGSLVAAYWGRESEYQWSAFLSPIFPSEAQPIQLTEAQEELVDDTRERIQAFLDKRTGIIVITVSMPDPAVAAQVVRIATAYLKRYVEEYRTEKARKDERFLQARVIQAQQRYRTAEWKWAHYRDGHQFIGSQVTDIERRRLESEYLFAQALFNELNRQLEQARIRVQEERPVFKLLEPAQVPTHRTKPKRAMIVIGFVLQGALTGLIVVFLRKGSIQCLKTSSSSLKAHPYLKE